MKYVSQEWQALPHDRRTEFEFMARDDKRRYDEELKKKARNSTKSGRTCRPSSVILLGEKVCILYRGGEIHLEVKAGNEK